MMTSEEKFKQEATANLMGSFSKHRSRRTLIKGAVAGAAGIAVAGTAGALLLPKGNAAHAASSDEPPEDTIAQILSIAATAEQLAVTFYSNGIAEASTLKISGANYDYLVAAVIEEQIHLDFLVAAGGKPLTSTFSFPEGEDTFDDQLTFVNTLQMLEEAFIAAYLAAVKEFSQYGQHRLAQIAAQIMGVEAEHRGLGRSISSSYPYADNYAFEPALVESVGDAVDVLTAEGFLSPKSGNSFTYKAVSTDNSHVIRRNPYAAGEDKD
ncbi:MAG: ferritin-like domain-containing protein [Ktedonobacteraceae bacterium]